MKSITEHLNEAIMINEGAILSDFDMSSDKEGSLNYIEGICDKLEGLKPAQLKPVFNHDDGDDLKLRVIVVDEVCAWIRGIVGLCRDDDDNDEFLETALDTIDNEFAGFENLLDNLYNNNEFRDRYGDNLPEDFIQEVLKNWDKICQKVLHKKWA